MTPPPSPSRPTEANGVPPASFYGHLPPPKRAGSQHTTFTTLPAPPTPATTAEPEQAGADEERSTAPSPELPPYSPTGADTQVLDDYKPPQVLPDSPEPPASLLHDPAAYGGDDWSWAVGENESGTARDWGPSGAEGEGEPWGSTAPAGSPNSMHVSARQSPEPWELGEAFAAMEDDGTTPRVRAPQYGDGLVQEKLAADLCSWAGSTYIPVVEMGRDVGELWNVTVVRVPDVPAPVPVTAPVTPVVLSSAPSMTSLQSAASAPEASNEAPSPTQPSTPPPPTPTAPQHQHNPPTLAEVRALLPYPLHLSIPFLPHAWLPLIISAQDYPSLSSPPALPLPQHPAEQVPCPQTPGRAHHFHLLPASVPPSSPLRLPAPRALDLWFCCQCRVHVLAPNRISGDPRTPAVVDSAAWGAYVEDRMRAPPVGVTGPEGILNAVETLLKMNEGLLWGGRSQCIKVRNPTFTRKVGWNDTVALIMNSMGWTISSESAWLAAMNPATPAPTTTIATSSSEPGDAQVLVPPSGVSHPTSEARKRLLMAWIELGAFALVWRRRFPAMKSSEFRFCVEVQDVRETLEEALGVPELFQHDTARAVPVNLRGPFEALGLGAHWSPKLLKTAYEMQCRCLYSRRTQFFDCISHIYETTQNDQVALLLAEERSRGRHTTLEVAEAYAELGFGEEGEIGMIGDESDDDAIWNAFLYRVGQWAKLGVQSAYAGPWAPQEYAGPYAPPPGPPPGAPAAAAADVDMDEPRGRASTRAGAGTPHPSHPDWATRSAALPREAVKQKLKDALEVIADDRGSVMLQNMLKNEAEQKFGMDVETAYGTLGVMAETDDEMVLAVFQTRCADAPGMTDRMLDALRSIATARMSPRLLRFLETGNPEADVPENTRAVVPLEFPRGLDQLGNTCYLNSLLQYFYTIRELRENVVDNSKLVDENELIESGALETMRVGGRLVTKREISRSAEFVRLLGVLFTQLSVADTASVTPELQLAKLALVTSQDEEDHKLQLHSVVSSPVETRQNTAPSSDATLVDQPMDGVEQNGTHVSTAESTNASSQPGVDGAAPNGASTAHSTPSATPGADSAPSPSDARTSPAPSGKSAPPFDHSPSVLGKRERDSSVRPSRSMMDIDSILDGSKVVKSPKRANTLPPADIADLEPLSFKRSMTDPMDVDAVDAKQRSASVDVEMRTEEGPAKEQPNGVVEAPRPPEAPKRPPPLPPRASTKRVEVQSDSFMMFGRQHDVSECMDNCMFQIEAALKPDEDVAEGSLVKRLFYGKLRQRVTSGDSSSVHMRDDPFAHIHINVGDEGFDLYDGLGGYFEDEVEYEGRKSRMDVTLVELPQLLQVQLQRVQFNRETFQAYKSNAYVKFGESLYLDRFLETADPLKRERSILIRKQLDDCRGKIHQLTQDKSGSFLEAMDNTRKFLDEQKQIELPDWNGDVSKMLEFERQELNRRIEELRAHAASLKEELEAIWASDNTAEYELCSVFIHRGNHAFGHYWLYSRVLPDHPDQWFKYNDSTITAVNKSEVLGDLTGSTANPYLLVYVKKGSDAVHAVHRLV
ncbi:cysteine proteinase [Calocera viscosa TUFC12733]|uniref:ubiquitinyl hydrolase 1 n=1 Tax=Calocera viscosa (strain TUFC12733) TaxID=1330018 RepID=A0A167H519_CALVF|nr:cysteine proteinase [Calocera viscosa TUFC12733]